MTQQCAAAFEENGIESNSPEAVAKRVHEYKYSTLPILGYLDELHKLQVVSLIYIMSIFIFLHYLG